MNKQTAGVNGRAAVEYSLMAFFTVSIIAVTIAAMAPIMERPWRGIADALRQPEAAVSETYNSGMPSP